MTCRNQGCPGAYEDREVIEVVRAGRDDPHFIVVERVPATVCDFCGDTLFTPETVERLQALRQAPPPATRSVPLYDFAALPAGAGG